MPKGRHLKPEFFTDKHIVSVQPLARLLYQGLWCYAADCGHLDDEPLELKMRILPADSCDVDELLTELVSTGRIQRAAGVITLPKLGDHARVDKRYETFCDACKEQREHGVNTTGKAAPKTPSTTGTRRGHDGDTTGTQRDHDADGDGDGDGDGMVKGAPKKRATQLPQGFIPNQANIELAAAEGIDLRREFAKFCDHNRAKGNVYKDWDAALRNWIRKAAEFGGNVRPLRPQQDEQGRLVLPPLPSQNEWSGR